MATTTNFGWETPDDTDLVKDGAAAIRTLGQSIDTSMADLEGGTTGQILSKNSNTDMDFVWIANDQGDITAVTAGTGISGGGTSGAVTVTNSMATAIDAKGDLIVGTGADTFSRLAVGATNGQVLTVDSSEATGLKYATPGGALTLSQIATGTLSGTSVTISSLSSYDYLFLQVFGTTLSSGSSQYFIRVNNEATSLYKLVGSEIAGTTISGISNGYQGAIYWNWNTDSLGTSTNNRVGIAFQNCKASGFTSYQANAQYLNLSSVQVKIDFNGIYTKAEAVSSLVIGNAGGYTFNAGTYILWGG